MGAKNNAPIIIKRKKVVAAGGHHGGAWKVAYADFVTAMMAFFLLMWLLNATTEKQRKGIADYFSPTIPVMRISGGGEGAFGGDSVFSEETLARNGTGANSKFSTPGNQARGNSGVDRSAEAAAASDQPLKEVQEALGALGGESMVSTMAARHIITRVTDEGLIVELFDSPNENLFEPGSDEPTDLLQELLGAVIRVFGLVENDVAINGYTRTYPIVLIQDPAWDLSAARAKQTRLLIEDGDFPSARIQRVTGYADRKPVVSHVMAPRNNRIELILLREAG